MVGLWRAAATAVVAAAAATALKAALREIAGRAATAELAFDHARVKDSHEHAGARVVIVYLRRLIRLDRPSVEPREPTGARVQAREGERVGLAPLARLAHLSHYAALA